MSGFGRKAIRIDEEVVPVIPGHPVSQDVGQYRGVLLKGLQIFERIDAAHVAGMDQAHEHVANECAGHQAHAETG